MKVDGLRKVALKCGQVLSKNSPTILTGIGVAGLITTAIMAVQATPKALSLIDEEVFRRYEDSLEGKEQTFGDYLNCPEGYSISERIQSLPKKDLIMITWKCYIPAMIMGGLTISCIIGANSINLRRNAALASIYSITETALKEYQGKVVEMFGENKAAKVQDAVYKDKVEKAPLINKEVIITGKGDTLCYDVLSGRYFKSDIETIRKIENKLNRDLLSEMFLSLNDVYYEFGLSGIRTGDELGWDIQNGLIEFNFSSQLAEGIPCLVIDYNIEPKYDFRDY